MAAPAQPNMDEILSSIRSTLEEETAKSGTAGTVADGVADDVLMLEEELSDDEILALTEEELGESGESVAGVVGATEEGLIDLAAFTASGSVTGARTTAPVSDDVLGVKLTAEPVVTETPMAEPVEALPSVSAETPPEEPAAEELDRLMEQIREDQAIPHAEKVAAILGDVPEPLVPKATEMTSQPVGMRMELPAVNGVNGLQVALPSAVLAEALRPLITDWLSENLPGVVERLVQAEIAKLANQ